MKKPICATSYSEENFAQIPDDRPAATRIAIRIASHPQELSALPDDFLNARYADVLTLYFADIHRVLTIDGHLYKPCSSAHAREIVAFILPHIENIDAIDVHCTMGIARSAGVVLALAELFPSIEAAHDEPYVLPHPTVFHAFDQLKITHPLLCKEVSKWTNR